MIGIYIRVSTLEQANEGYSIAAQRERLTAFCQAQGWSEYVFYVDEGISGKDTKRPELNRLMNDVEKGKVSTILVYRLDRFTRSVLDLHKMLENMDKHNCVFKSATEPYDTSTAMGRMFITIVAALAQWEVENSSERIKMALEEKVSNGQRVGNIPFGFDLNEEEKLVKNDKSLVLLDMVQKASEGYSSKRIAEFLNKTNSDKSWTANTVLRLLRNPALCGDTRWNDKVYKDTHEGIITKDEFAQLQQRLKERSISPIREVKSVYLFQSKLVCPGCGKKMSVNRFVHKRSKGGFYTGVMYRCQPCGKIGNFNKSVNENSVLNGLYDYMKDLQFENITPDKQKPKNIYLEQLEQIEKKREKYQRAWSNDLMTDDEFKKLMDETRGIYEELKQKVDKETGKREIDPIALNKITHSFNENFKILTPEEKRTFISMFVREIVFEIIPQPPKRPDKSSRGVDKIVIKKVVFM